MTCTNGHEAITFELFAFKLAACPLCAMRRHVKAAQERLRVVYANYPSVQLEYAMLRLESAINLAGQRTPDLPAEAALQRVDAAIDRFAKAP